MHGDGNLERFRGGASADHEAELRSRGLVRDPDSPLLAAMIVRLDRRIQRKRRAVGAHARLLCGALGKPRVAARPRERRDACRRASGSRAGPDDGPGERPPASTSDYGDGALSSGVRS